MKHACHARGCAIPVPPEMLFCGSHWRRVPQKIQKAVWAAYRVGQCNDRMPSDAWLEAANAAIGFVAAVEGRLLTASEKMAIQKYGYDEKELNKEPRR